MTFKSFLTQSVFIVTALTASSYAAQELTNVNEFNQLIQNGKPTVIKFSAPWCPPCRQYAPHFDAVSSDVKFNAVQFAKVSNDKCPLMAQQNIRSLPTTIFYANGKEIARKTGGLNKVGLEQLINTHLKIS